MADETPMSSTLATILAVGRRRKWLGILSFAAVFPAAATVIMFLPQLYQSVATVLVVGQQIPSDLVRSTVTGSLDTRLQTMSQEILSRSRLEGLIDKLDLYPDLRPTLSVQALVDHMRRDIEVRPAVGLDRVGATVAFPSLAFTIKYRGTDAQTVALVTNTLASYYIDENLKVRERQATGTSEFLRVQIADVKARLDAQGRQVSDFKRKHLGELPTQLDANLGTLERLNSQFRLNGDKQLRAQEQRQELTKLIDSMAALADTSIGPTTPAATTTRPTPADPNAARLARMKQDLADQLARFTDRYPDVIHMKAEIAALERQIRDTKRSTPPQEAVTVDSVTTRPAPASRRDPAIIQMEQALSQLDVDLKALKAEEAELRAAMTTYQKRVDNTPRLDQEFQELTRDFDSTRNLYANLMRRFEEAQLSENLEQRQKGEQFRILEPAAPAGFPVAPNRPRLLLVGLALSIGLSLGLMVLVEQLDTSFHTVDDLQAATNIPVLVSIPRIVTDADVRWRRWRLRFATVAAVCVVVLVIGASYFVATGNEQLLRLVTPGRF